MYFNSVIRIEIIRCQNYRKIVEENKHIDTVPLITLLTCIDKYRTNQLRKSLYYLIKSSQ